MPSSIGRRDYSELEDVLLDEEGGGSSPKVVTYAERKESGE